MSEGAPNAVVGIDAGTTSAKAVVLDEAGRTVGWGASEPITTDTWRPGASEQDPTEIREAVSAAIRRAIDDGDGETKVVAVAIAAQSGSVVPVGAGERRRAAVTWMDTRAQPVVDSWSAAERQTIRSVSGWSATAGVGLATIAWLGTQEHAPHESTERWVSVDDHLVHELTGQWVTNPSNAAGMQLMDASTLAWSPRLCGLAGVEPSQLSRIEASGHDLGAVGDRGRGFGLARDVHVLVGGHDQACAALGLGAVKPGDIVLSAGTAWVLSVITPLVSIADLPDAFNLSPHVAPGQWSASRFIGPLGAVLAGCLADLAADDLDTALASVDVRADDPHFVPNLTEPDRTNWGVLVGSVSGDHAVVRARAAVEACAFEVRRAIEMAPTPDGDRRPLLFVGGGTRSRHLSQMIADATSRDVLVFPDASWPAIGAARIAATALGWPTASEQPDSPTRVTHRPDRDGIRERRYMTYLQLTSGERS